MIHEVAPGSHLGLVDQSLTVDDDSKPDRTAVRLLVDRADLIPGCRTRLGDPRILYGSRVPGEIRNLDREGGLRGPISGRRRPRVANRSDDHRFAPGRELVAEPIRRLERVTGPKRLRSRSHRFIDPI